ncbi:FkbM family methyltransferase [Sulfidibacter corallicola]|uniref:FkbM family methyltransferase n=1 Tax=Sulfidibacter corallicola TaxID=2818388 RepID=A0A8A4TS72_SULCO|nr:FkbM family methyltransferase [Sulfidibacter corallicola]QTD51912.1 FkbM family methyltransferase [Sulfidibacter corallicola]
MPHPSMIVAHHIGGRKGSGGFVPPEPFHRDVHPVYYDADTDCLAEMKSATGDGGTALSRCIDARTGSKPFHLCYDPNLSSLLEISETCRDFAMYHYDFEKGPMDYQLGDTGRIMETRTLEATSLDALCYGGGPCPPPPDYLSLDTQGSEFDILTGAEKALSESILAIALEVEFQPLYQDQKCFGDIFNYLIQRGFRFIDFTSLQRMSPSREAIGLRTQNMLTYGEALFLRAPESLPNPEERTPTDTRLWKLALIALCGGQFEYALTCLRRLAGCGAFEHAGPELRERAYFPFLRDLAALAETHPKRLPPLFTEVYSHAESTARFDPNRATSSERAAIFRLVEKLRREVGEGGGRRLCLLPFGHYARQLKALNADHAEESTVPVACFDNQYARHREAGHDVHAPESLTPEDFVLILSNSYGPELARQVGRIRGDRPRRTLTYQEILEGRQSFGVAQQDTEVEAHLKRHHFFDLAERLQSLRERMS